MDRIITSKAIVFTYLAISTAIFFLRQFVDTPVNYDVFPVFAVLGPIAFIGISTIPFGVRFVPYLIAYSIASILFFATLLANRRYKWVQGIYATTLFTLIWLGLGAVAVFAIAWS